MQVAKRVFIFLLLFWPVFQLFSPLALAWQASVVSVGDGDSLKVRRDTRVLKVRLYGIDSPELNQAHGRAARSVARQWLPPGRQIEVEPMYRDNYGRIVALVWVQGRLINAELVQSGAAWVYPRFCRSQDICRPMNALQEEARQARRGLWQEKQPEPPWQWKRRQPQQGRR
ncbi:MAG: thermonuclease family protein [bacterium]|nr:thermonuclease family protein [bacterium]